MRRGGLRHATWHDGGGAGSPSPRYHARLARAPGTWPERGCAARAHVPSAPASPGRYLHQQRATGAHKRPRQHGRWDKMLVQTALCSAAAQCSAVQRSAALCSAGSAAPPGQVRVPRYKRRPPPVRPVAFPPVPPPPPPPAANIATTRGRRSPSPRLALAPRRHPAAARPLPAVLGSPGPASVRRRAPSIAPAPPPPGSPPSRASASSPFD